MAIDYERRKKKIVNSSWDLSIFMEYIYIKNFKFFVKVTLHCYDFIIHSSR